MRINTVTGSTTSGLVKFLADGNVQAFRLNKASSVETQTIDALRFRFFVPIMSLYVDFDLSLPTFIGGVDYTGTNSESALDAIGILFLNAGSGATTTLNIAVGEVMAGVIDGVNKTFSFANTPKVSKDQILLNGITQQRAVDYSILNNTITFVNAPESATQDVVTTNYIY